MIRSLLIVEKFYELYPNVKIILSTGIDRRTIQRFLRIPFQYRKQSFEPGTIQKNCFEVDSEATRKVYLKYSKTRKQMLHEEIFFLRDAKCRGLVSDIPSIPIRAAADLGIQAVGVSNFTWDWILSPIFAGSPLTRICDQMFQDYASGNLHIQLPLGTDASPFPVCEKAPIVARTAKLGSKKVQKMLGISKLGSRKLILVCPGGWDTDNWKKIELKDCKAFQFIFVGDLPIEVEAPHLHLPHRLMNGLTFPDLVNAADLVVAKPGYGIASECLVHGTPLLAIERPDFRETPLLIDQFKALAPCSEMSLKEFFHGQWRSGIEEALLNRTSWKKMPKCGAEIVAEKLVRAFSM